MRLLALVVAFLSTVWGPVAPDEARRATLWYGGDSISNGYDCPGCRVLGRVFAAQAGLRVAASSLGLDGHTFAQFSAAVRRIPRAGVVVIELGTNDFLQALPPEEVRGATRDLLDRVREANPSARLFCVGVSSPSRAVNGLGLRPADYDQVIAAECRLRRGTFVPIAEHLDLTPGALLPDLVHISQAGHDLIGRLLFEAYTGNMG
jgi:lysophospholipase L1-like esterase